MHGLRKVIIAALGALVLVTGAQAQSPNTASPQALPPESQSKPAGQASVEEQVTPQISAADSALASESPPALQPAPRSQQQVQLNSTQPAAAPTTTEPSHTGQKDSNLEDQLIKKTVTEG